MNGKTGLETQSGFSLVELSIVLVILGLLVGGILGGQSLIHAAELRAVTTERDAWQTAVNTFRQRYFAIPGDFKKAGDFWGYVNTSGTGGNCSAPATDTGTGTQTCSGNGTGTIDQDYEMFRFWQHLANAGLITGKFTGVAGSGSGIDAIIGENIPSSKFSSGGWDVRTFGNNPGMDGFYFAYDYGNLFQIGAMWAGTVAHAPLMTPEDAWNIDTKLDDGQPGQGSVISMILDGCTDTDDADDAETASYKLDNSQTACGLLFTKAF